jgi:hypothetical protein
MSFQGITTTFGGGADFSTTMTFGGGAGFSITTTLVGGVTTVTGACAGGLDAQALRMSAAPSASEYRRCIGPHPATKMPTKW